MVPFSFSQLKEMVSALLNESELILSDDVIETIVEKVFLAQFCILSIFTILFVFKNHHLVLVLTTDI